MWLENANLRYYFTKSVKTRKKGATMPQPIKEDRLQHLEQVSGLQFVKIPAGTYTVGDTKKASKFAIAVSNKIRKQSPICLMRQTAVQLPAFYISRDVVRVSHWRRLLRSQFGKALKKAVPTALAKASGYNFVKDYRSGSKEYKSFAKDKQEDDPALTLPYTFALKVASILGGVLPEWVQWEVAARGAESYLFPWGNQFELDKVQMTASRREASLIEYRGDVYHLDSFGHYAGASSPFGLQGLARWGMEWNSTSQLLNTVNLGGRTGAVIEDHLLRSICDLAFNEVVIQKKPTHSHVALARRNHRAFVGTTLAMMLPPKHGHQVAAFRLLYLAEPTADLPEKLAEGLKKLGHLQPRLFELAAFPAHFEIPTETVERLWAHTANYSTSRANLTMRVMRSFGLLRFTPVSKKNRRLAEKLDSYQGRRFWRGKLPYDTIRLADELAAYLQTLPLDQVELHGQLLQAHRPPSGKFADLPRTDPYLWDHLLSHLAHAERLEELAETITDFGYLATRSYLYGAEIIKKDINFAQRYVSDANLLQRIPPILQSMWPLMRRCTAFPDMLATLYSGLSRLSQQQANLQPLAKQLKARLQAPYLVVQQAIPDKSSDSASQAPQPTPSPPLFGLAEVMARCTISADGQLAFSALADGALKALENHTGESKFTLPTGAIRDAMLSADGQTLLSVGIDDSLKAWNAQTGALRFTLMQHLGALWHDTRQPGITSCAISANGQVIVSALPNQLSVWDAATQKKRLTLRPIQGTRLLPLQVAGCAISGDGTLILSRYQNSADLHGWDAQSGQLRFILPARGAYLTRCALSHDGSTIATAYSGQFRGTLKIWDGQTGAERHTMHAHDASITSCAISQDGKHILTVSLDQTIKLWQATTGTCLTTLALNEPLHDCAISAEGKEIVVLSAQETYFLRLVM